MDLAYLIFYESTLTNVPDDGSRMAFLVALKSCLEAERMCL